MYKLYSSWNAWFSIIWIEWKNSNLLARRLRLDDRLHEACGLLRRLRREQLHLLHQHLRLGGDSLVPLLCPVRGRLHDGQARLQEQGDQGGGWSGFVWLQVEATLKDGPLQSALVSGKVSPLYLNINYKFSTIHMSLICPSGKLLFLWQNYVHEKEVTKAWPEPSTMRRRAVIRPLARISKLPKNAM